MLIHKAKGLQNKEDKLSRQTILELWIYRADHVMCTG